MTRQGLGPEEEIWACMRDLQQDSDENETEMKKLENWDWAWLNERNRTGQGVLVGERLDCNKDRQKKMSSRVADGKTWREKQTSSQGWSCTRCALEPFPLNTTVSLISEHTHQQKACKPYRYWDDRIKHFCISALLYKEPTLTHPCQMRTTFAGRKNESTCHVLKLCVQSKRKLLILMLLHCYFLSLIIPSSPLTKMLWKQMKHSRTTLVDNRKIHYENNHSVYTIGFQ